MVVVRGARVRACVRACVSLEIIAIVLIDYFLLPIYLPVHRVFNENLVSQYVICLITSIYVNLFNDSCQSKEAIVASREHVAQVL